MPKYALLLPHATDRYTTLTEDDYMDIIKDYVAWVDDLSNRGVFEDGHKLTDQAGRVLTRSGDTVEVHEMPFAEMNEILGGLMIINAADWDAAVEIAKTCPHMVHNERLEIRQIDDTTED